MNPLQYITQQTWNIMNRNSYTLTDKKKERLVKIIEWVDGNRNLLDNDSEILNTLNLILTRGFYKESGKELLNTLESYIK